MSEFQKLGDFKFSGKDVMGWLEQAGQTLGLLMFILGVLPVFIGHLFVQLLYGALELGISAGFGCQLNFSSAMRLAVVAMSPTILISTIIWAAMPFSPPAAHLLDISGSWWLISIPLSIGFLILAASGARKAMLTNVPEVR